MKRCLDCGVNDLPDGLSHCPNCGGRNLSKIGSSKSKNPYSKTKGLIKRHPIISIIVGLIIAWIAIKASGGQPVAVISPFLFTLGVFAIYFLPSIIAGKRNHANGAPIGIINLCFGWTLLGWVICLAWACSDNVREPERADN